MRNGYVPNCGVSPHARGDSGATKLDHRKGARCVQAGTSGRDVLPQAVVKHKSG